MAKNITWDRDSKIRDFLDVDNAIHALAVYSALRTKFAPELPAIDVVSFIRERNNEVNESQWYSPEAEAVTVRALQILEGEGKVYDGKTDPVEALTLLLESGCGILTYKRSRIAGTNTFVITEPRIERGAENIETLCKNLKVDDLADIPEYLNGRFVAVIDNTISQEQEQALRKLIEQPQFAPIREKASVIFGKLSRYDRVKPFYAMADRRRGNFVRRRELR